MAVLYRTSCHQAVMKLSQSVVQFYISKNSNDSRARLRYTPTCCGKLSTPIVLTSEQGNLTQKPLFRTTVV